jgi:molecular chaperone GrpE
MSEIEKPPAAESEAGQVDESQARDDMYFGLGDEPGLDVIEGLAEDEREKPAAQGVVPEIEPAAPSPRDDALLLRDALSELGTDLGRRLDGLRTTFERELRAEATRERVIDRLHAELQEYKQDLLLKVQRPIFIDLIQLHDDVGKMMDAKSPSDSADASAETLRGILESIQTAIEDILYRQGVEPFDVEGGEFDPRRQRAVSTVTTDDPALNKTVALRLRKGFVAGDKLIRPEIVSVFTFREVPAPPPS